MGHLGHHDPWVMTGGSRGANPTKRRKYYKYETKEETLAACRRNRNRAQKGRHRCAKMHELAASREKTPHKAMFVGGQKKKRRVCWKWARSIQHTKQRRKWRRAENSQIL